MTKTLKLVSLSLLALTVVGCGKKAIVPEKTVAAAYIDFEKAYDNGKDFANTIIGALPSEAKSQARSEYEEALKKIDKFKDDLNTEWAVVAFGGDLKSLSESRNPENNIAVAIKVKAGEDEVKKVLKDVLGVDKVETDKKNGNVIFELDGIRLGLVDEKYIIFSPSKNAFDDMFDLYAGNGKRSDDFGDLSKISGDTICRVSTAPISSLLKRFELTREIEKFGESCDDEDMAEMILDMGAISLDVGIGDEVGLALSVDCDSSSEAKIVENLMGSVAFLARVGCDVGAYGANNPELLDVVKATDSDKAAIATAKDLFVSLARKIKVDRDGSAATLSVALDVKKLADLIEKTSSGKGSGSNDDGGSVKRGSSFSSYRSESLKNACVSNMKQLQAAAEQYMMAKGKIPTLKDLCGPDKYLRNEPTCPKGGSHYRIVDEGGGDIGVKCGSGDPEHVLP